MASKVYFIKNVTAENVVKMYDKLGVKLPGKVAVKVHSGEEGNQNYLKPAFWKPMVEHVNGTIVECNTAYEGERNYTDKHIKLLKRHGWNELFDVDLMDAEGPDIEIPVKNGTHLKTDIMGKNLLNYDSMLVLSHFKGHPMGGFGGALKQLSIGCASCAGKVQIHSAGKYKLASEQDVVHRVHRLRKWQTFESNACRRDGQIPGTNAPTGRRAEAPHHSVPHRLPAGGCGIGNGSSAGSVPAKTQPPPLAPAIELNNIPARQLRQRSKIFC